MYSMDPHHFKYLCLSCYDKRSLTLIPLTPQYELPMSQS